MQNAACEATLTPTSGGVKPWPHHLIGEGLIYVLVRGKPTMMVPGEVVCTLFDLAGIEDPVVLWCPQKIADGRTHRKENVEEIRYLTVDLDNPPIPPEEIPGELERRGFPEPWVVVRTPHGVHVYWRLKVLPGTPHNVRRYEDTARLMVKALRDLGADPRATDVAHLFRLNEIKPLAFGDRTTTLDELREAAVRLVGEPTPERNSTRTNRRPTGKPRGKLWDSPAIRWIRTHLIPEGHRNTAATALAIALFHDGKEPEEILETLNEWAKFGTRPRYPYRELRDAVRSLARRWERGEPLGLTVERLTEIHDVNGEHLPESLARATVALLPPVHERKPIEERKRKPRIYHLAALLEGKQIPKTTQWRLKKVVNYLQGVGNTKGAGSNCLWVWNPQLFLMGIAKAGLWPSEEHSRNSMRFWARQEPAFWVQLLEAVRRFLAKIAGRRGKHALSSGDPLADGNGGGSGKIQLQNDFPPIFVGRSQPPLTGGLLCLGGESN